MKKCKNCGVVYESVYDNFYVDKRNNDGLFSSCKKCIIKRSKHNAKIMIDKDPFYYKKISKKWRDKNNGGSTERYRSYAKIYYKNKRETDENFNIANRLRNSLWCVVKGIRCSKKTLSILGLNSRDDFLKHLESKFYDNMCWENYGINGWCLDHIIPINNFDLTNKEQLYRCFNHKNIKPMWFKENCSKGKNY